MAKAAWIAQQTDARLVRELFPVRKRDTHKGEYGKVLLLCGSEGLTGAARLAAKAALRTGSGLVYLFVFLCMAFAAGFALRWIFLGVGGAVGGFLAAWNLNLLRGDWYARIKVILDHSYDVQGKGFQQTRGLLALGSGRLTGQGLFNGTQTQSSSKWSLPERQTDFIDIVAWRSTAEFVSKYFTKGSMAAVSGRLQIREWTDREGGKRTTAEVVADNVYFGESKRRDGGDTSRPAAPSASAPAHRGSYGGYDNVPQGGSAFSELDDDDGDLPF